MKGIKYKVFGNFYRTESEEKFRVEVFFCSDYSFMTKWLGLLEPNCHHFCAWCNIHQHEVKQQVTSGNKASERSFNNWIQGQNGIQVTICSNIT